MFLFVFIPASRRLRHYSLLKCTLEKHVYDGVLSSFVMDEFCTALKLISIPWTYVDGSTKIVAELRVKYSLVDLFL